MITLTVKVKPNARQKTITRLPDNTWIIRLKSPPTEGKTNQELIALLAKKFGINQSQVQIKTGHSARFKRIEIDAEEV